MSGNDGIVRFQTNIYFTKQSNIFSTVCMNMSLTKGIESSEGDKFHSEDTCTEPKKNCALKEAVVTE